MTQIENFADWTKYVNQLQNDLRVTYQSIKERNSRIEEGVPKQQLTRQHVQNQRTLRQLDEKLSFAQRSLSDLNASRSVLPQQLSQSERKLAHIQSQINDAKTQCNLYSDGNSQSIEMTGETEDTRGMTNTELMDETEEIKNKQDEQLGQLHNKLQVEIGKAKEINDELDRQDAQIDRVNNKIEHEDKRIKKATESVMYLSKQSACIHYVIIIFLVILLIVQVATGNFGLGFG